MAISNSDYVYPYFSSPTSSLLQCDLFLYWQFRHLHAKCVLQHELCLPEDLFELPPICTQHFLCNVGSSNGLPGVFATQRISHKLPSKRFHGFPG
jgi:hypothetical protein